MTWEEKLEQAPQNHETQAKKDAEPVEHKHLRESSDKWDQNFRVHAHPVHDLETRPHRHGGLGWSRPMVDPIVVTAVDNEPGWKDELEEVLGAEVAGPVSGGPGPVSSLRDAIAR